MNLFKQRFFSSQSSFKMRKCSDRDGKCVEVPKDVIFELYETIDNLKNAFNNPHNFGRNARTLPVNNKCKCSGKTWKRRRACKRKCRNQKRVARNQAAQTWGAQKQRAQNLGGRNFGGWNFGGRNRGSELRKQTGRRRGR